ncbi:hypothetical protein J2810_004600 [Chryseobacterium rhizosphaerae]|uniref:hypothetical protein n=1 Tax=Chryseobacterium rhizosphaerae TaxID=395937 RepID=UPI00285B4D90|nr:hypothetical protein [Chryseobacterium rhizosphaerae]MDR6548510.1 hypothetical protein [Chryseobacterium rhizosphaerae]
MKATDKNKIDYSKILKKATENSVNPPIQKVVPVKKPITETETKFTFFIPLENMKKLKFLAAERDTTIKELINTAIYNQYLKD